MGGRDGDDEQDEGFAGGVGEGGVVQVGFEPQDFVRRGVWGDGAVAVGAEEVDLRALPHGQRHRRPMLPVWSLSSITPLSIEYKVSIFNIMLLQCCLQLFDGLIASVASEFSSKLHFVPYSFKINLMPPKLL